MLADEPGYVPDMFSLRSGVVDDRSVLDETVFAAKDAAACVAHRVLRRHVNHERSSGMIFRFVEDKGQVLFAPRQKKSGALRNFRHRAKWLGGQKSRRLSLVFNSLDDFFRDLFASQDVLVGNG